MNDTLDVYVAGTDKVPADLEVGRDYGVLIMRPLGLGMHRGAIRKWSQTSLGLALR